MSEVELDEDGHGAWSPAELPRGGGRVVCELGARTALLVLDQPEVHNAVSPGMMLDLDAAVRQLEGWSGAAVVVTGAGGKAFCSGGDLRVVREHLVEPGVGRGMSAWMTGVLDRLSALPAVVIAAVEGAALGGGAELLTAADLVVCARTARIGFVHAALGVSPGWGGGRRLRRRIGAQRALRMLALAERHDGEGAAALGVVDVVVDPGRALAEAQRLAMRLAGHPEGAVAAAKRIATTGDARVEADAFETLWGGPGHLAALARGSSRRE